jgi:hypothetical protein
VQNAQPWLVPKIPLNSSRNAYRITNTIAGMGIGGIDRTSVRRGKSAQEPGNLHQMPSAAFSTRCGEILNFKIRREVD